MKNCAETMNCEAAKQATATTARQGWDDAAQEILTLVQKIV